MLKKVLFPVLFMAFCGSLFAQQVSYKDMMYDNRYNVYDVIDAAEKYFETHPTGQGSGYKGYMRWRTEIEPLFYPTGDRSQFQPDILAVEYQKIHQARSSQKVTAGPGEHWRFMGPDQANNLLSASYAAGVGRVEAVWAGFASPDTVLLGARYGGFWKTVDGGATWKSTTQNLPAVGVYDIEVNPNNHNEIWICTRHGSGYSLGLMKSTDFGDTWNTTSISRQVTNYELFYDLYIEPSNPNLMYLRSGANLYRSTDGGNNWATPLSGFVRSFAINPTNPSNIFVVHNSDRNSVLISTDMGNTWSDTTTITANNNRTPWIATTAANPNVLYFASSEGVWKSTDKGVTFTNMGPNPAAPTGMMTFGVSDTDEDLVIAGSLDQFISYNGGATFSLFAAWVNSTANNYVHADGRVVRSWDGDLYFGTDGYLARSFNNGGTWTKVNDAGTGIKEFYRIGTSVSRTDRVLGGSQDNGTSVLLDSTWYEWFGGDGMECHFNWTIPDIWFANWQFGGLRRTMNNGVTTNSIKPQTSGGSWITPSVMDRLNESTLFIGYDTLFKSTDHGSSWTVLKDFSADGNLNNLAIAPSDSNYLYASRNSKMWRSNDNGTTWIIVSSGLPNRSISRIAVHPRDPQRVVATFSGFSLNEKVFESTNGGLNWNNIGSGLPNLPVQCAVWQDTQLDRLFIGQDGAIWYRDVNNPGWIVYADSLPIQPFRDLEILHGANTIRAGVFGRGVWEAPLPGTANSPRIVRIDIDPEVNTFNKPSDRDSVAVAAFITSVDPLSNTRVEWGLDGVNFPNSLPMAWVANDSFRTTASIPPHALGQQIYFRVRAEDMDGDTARSEGIVYRVKKAVLCPAGGTIGTGSDWISNVNTVGINNNTPQSAYTDYFSTHQTTMIVGQTYSVTVTLNAVFSCDSIFGWVDFNGNLAFESNEKIVFSTPNAFNTATGSFTIPLNAVRDTVVMRVRNIYDCGGAIADPCDNYAGEVEDYGIIIQDPFLSISPAQPDWVVFPNPAQTHVKISAGAPIADFALFDMRGVRFEVPFSQNGDAIELNVSELAAGVYLFRGKVNGIFATTKITVE